MQSRSLPLAAALLGLSLTGAASAQISTLQPFNLNATFGVGGNGLQRPLVDNTGYQTLSLSGLNANLNYSSNTRSYSPDFTSGTFTILAQRGTPDGQPITYQEEWTTWYQDTTRYYQTVLPNLVSPASGDVAQDLTRTDLCSVRVRVSQRCGATAALYFLLDRAQAGYGRGYFYSATQDTTTDPTQPELSTGYQLAADPAREGYVVVSGETLWERGMQGQITEGYLDITGKQRIPLHAGTAFTTPSPDGATACTVEIPLLIDDSLCVDPVVRDTAEVHGQMTVADPTSGCDWETTSGCPVVTSGYPRVLGSLFPDNAGYDNGGSLDRAPNGLVIDYTAPNDFQVPAGYFAMQYSRLNYSWPDGHPSYLNLPQTPGANLWSPPADLTGVNGSGQPPKAGFYPDGSLWMPSGSTNAANFNGKGAVVTASLTPRACVALPDLATSSYYQVDGAYQSDTAHPFIAPDGSTRYPLSGNYLAEAWAYMTTDRPGKFEALALPGAWTETLFSLDWSRALDGGPSVDYLNEHFYYFLRNNPLTLATATETHTPDRALLLGKLNIRMYVQNAPGSGPRLRPFQSPSSIYGSVVDSTNYQIATGIHTYGPAVSQTEHILHLVAPAGVYHTYQLAADVPLNPDGTGTLASTQFPTIPDVTLLPPTESGQCQAICIDATTQLSYSDDETPPLFTAQLDTPLDDMGATHTNPVHFSGTARDLTPIDLTVNDQVKQTLPGNNTANTWAVTTVLQRGPNTVTVAAVDKCGERSDLVFQITIVNQPPTLDPIPPQTIYETDTATIQLVGHDADLPPDTLTYSYDAADLPAGANITFNPATGAFTWVTDYSSEGVYNVHFHVTDGTDTATQVGMITVLHKNAPPIFNAVADLTIPEKSLLTFTVHATDFDNDPLTYSATNLPAGATFDVATQQFNWVPDYGTAPGPYLVHFVVIDGNGGTGTLDVTIHVLHTNRPPVPVDVEQTIYEQDDLTVTLQASDPDVPAFDTLTYAIGARAPAFVTFDSGTPSVRLQPVFGQAGDYSFIVLVSDGHVAVPLHVLIHVLHKNRPPVLDPIPDRIVAVDTSLSFVITGHDPDKGDTLTFSQQTPGANSSFNPDTQTFTFVPDHTQCGLNTFTFRVTDAAGLFDTGSGRVAVVCIDRAPVVAAVPDVTVYEKDHVNVSVSATDPDGDALRYSIGSSLPAGANLDGNTLSWTPDYGQAGVYLITYLVSDGTLTVAAIGKITVLHRNRPPVFDPPLIQALQLRRIQEGSPLSFTLLATDPDVGDVVTYGLVSGLPAGATFDAATGFFNWTPAFGTARAQTYDLTFSASDGTATTLGLAHILVLKTNRPPVWVAATVVDRQAAEGAPLAFAVQATDADNDSLTYSSTSLPAGATLDGTTGAFSWTPGPGKAGAVQVTFVVSDGQSAVPATITIGVAHTNHPPAIDPIPSRTIAEGQLLTFIVNASDPDGDPVSVSAALPSTAQFDPAGRVFSFVPPYGIAPATVSVTFTASDGRLTATRTVSIVVTHTNRPPSLNVVGELRVREEQQLVLTLQGSDPDGDALTYSATNLPDGASFDPTARTVTWTPRDGQAGSYKPTFTVSDGQLQDSTSPQITVDHLNHPPVIDPIADRTITEGSPLSFIVTAHDPDGDTLAYGSSALPDNAVFDTNSRTYQWTPARGQAGQYTMTFSASDGQYTVSTTTHITVVAGPLPPSIDPQGPFTVKEGGNVDFTITTHDPAGRPVTCTAAPLPSDSTWNASSVQFHWTTQQGSAGTYRVPVSCSDGAMSVATSVTIVVLPNKLRIEGAGVLGCSSASSAGWLLLLPLGFFLRRKRRSSALVAAALACTGFLACAKGATSGGTTAQSGGTGALVGRVIIGAESDMSGVAVSAEGPTSATVLTAPDGSYSFTGLSAGSYAVLISAPRTLEATAALQAAVGADQTAQLADQRFTPVGDISGQVSYQESRDGSAGITVIAAGTASATSTDQGGRFVLRDVPAGVRQIVATSQGYGSLSATVTVHWGTMAETAALVLTPAIARGRIHGRAALAGLANSRGVTVTLQGSQAQGTVTDDTGAYSFENVADGTWFVSASAASTAEGTLQASAVVVAGASVQVRDLMLTPLGDLYGTATLGQTHGNSGIAVVVAGSAASGVALDDGSWFIRGAPIGPARVIASFPGYVPASADAIAVHYAQAVQVQALTLPRAVPGGAISGRVVLGGESSHAGVAVRVTGPQSNAATTGDDGAYQFAGLPDGYYTIFAQANSTAEGTLIANATVQGGTTVAPLLVFTPLGSVSGHALLGAGSTNNQGISIAAAGSPSLAATADSTGSFVLDRVPTGPRTIVASAPGFTSASAQVNVRYAAVAALPAPLTLVKPLPAGAVFGRALLAGQSDQSGIILTLAGAASGQFTTGASGDYLFANLADGTYAVTATARSTRETSVTGTTAVIAGGAAHLVLPDLTPLGAVSGSIAFAPQAGQRKDGILISVPGTNAATTTDENGRFLLQDVPSGQRIVHASLSGWLDATVPLAIPYAQTLILSDPLQLQQSSGGGALSGLVTFFPPADASGLVVTLTGPQGGAARTDAAGAFSFANLPDGTYAVEATDPCSLEGEATQAAQLVAGAQQSALVLSLTAFGSVTGTVKNADDGSAARAVEVSLSTGASATTDASGQYRFDRVPAGDLSVQAAGVVSPVTVQRCQQAEADLAIDPSALGAIGTTVHVVGALPGAGVSAVITRGNLALGAVTAADGSFAFRDLTAGSYSLALTAADGPHEFLPAVLAQAGSNGTVLAAEVFPLGPIELQRGTRVAQARTPALAAVAPDGSSAAVLFDAFGVTQYYAQLGAPCDALLEFFQEPLCKGALNLVRADGTVQLVARDAIRPAIRYSPSGRFLLYVTGDPQGGATSLSVQPLFDAPGYSFQPRSTQYSYLSQAQFSGAPGAERALLGAYDRNQGSSQIYQADLETGAQRLIGNNVSPTSGRYLGGGARVLYQDYYGRVYSTALEGRTLPLQLTTSAPDNFYWLPCPDPRNGCYNYALSSPDGSAVAFTISGVVTIVSATDATMRTALGSSNQLFASPDSSSLLWQDAQSHAVLAAPLQIGSTATVLDAAADQYTLALSPDRLHVAWLSGSGKTLCVALLDGTAPACVSTGAQTGYAAWLSPRSLQLQGSSPRAYVLGAAKVTQLPGAGGYSTYATSPDGLMQLAVLGGATQQLSLVRLDTGASAMVGDASRGIVDCQFSTDSTGFACRTPSKGENIGPASYPMGAFSVAQCFSGGCGAFEVAQHVYDFTYLPGPAGSSTLLWLQDPTVPQGYFSSSGPRGALYAAGPDGSGAALLGADAPTPIGLRNRYPAGYERYLPYLPRISPDGNRLFFYSGYSMGIWGQAPTASSAQLNVVDVRTFESLRAPQGLNGSAALGAWMNAGTLVGLKQRSFPYAQQDGVYLHSFDLGGAR